MGTAFLGKLNNKKYIVKVSKCIPKFLEPGNEVWKELEFYTTFAKKKHKNKLLLYTYGYKIINDCVNFTIQRYKI